MQSIKDIEEKCYTEFARFIFKQYYKQMQEQKMRELSENKSIGDKEA